MEVRQHGVLAEPVHQIEGAVEGICISSSDATKTVVFYLPSVSSDLKYGPAPLAGRGVVPTAGARLLVVFASNGRPWVVGWTTQS